MYLRRGALLSPTVNTLNEQVTAALQSYMDDHGITRTTVAKHLGRSASYVSGRMNGNHDVSIDIIAAVAELTHVTPRALMVEITERMAR